MTIGTIIIIILALVVLIFLIYSFMKGGGSLLDNLKNFFGGGTNVDTIKNAFTAACTTQSTYGFCSESRDLRTEKSTFKGSCATLAGNNGVATCPAISCTAESLPKTCDKTSLGIIEDVEWAKSCAAGNDKTSLVGNSGAADLKVTPYCCVKAAAGKKCTDLGGKWGTGVCVGKPDLSSQVTDTSDRGANTFCCTA